MLGPIDAVEEPVEDQQQYPDRDHRDDGLELLAVARQRGEDGLREHPGDGPITTSAKATPTNSGRRKRRSAPIMLAIRAARISTASSPSRRTRCAPL